MERWEYRTFGLNFNIDLSDFKFITQTKSREFYILVDSNLNIKIRDNTLDIKVLKETKDSCQKWGVKLKESFPIKSTILKEIFDLNYLHTTISQLDFLDEVSKKYRVIEVNKVRNKYVLNSTLFEITNLRVENFCIKTIAIEDENLTLLKELIKKYKIDEFENLSYTQFLNNE